MENNVNYQTMIDKKKKPNKEFNSTLSFLLVLLAVVVIVTIVFTQIFNGVVVWGDSMNNTLIDGDYLYMQVNYTRIEHGDIIVLDSGEKLANGETKYLIKRVIALPGDSIYAENGKLYRKEKGESEFKLIVEDYLPEKWTDKCNIASKTSPLTLEQNAIFFMGDNRNNSEDSRGHYNTLTCSHVVGIVTPWSISCKGFLTKLFNLF